MDRGGLPSKATNKSGGNQAVPVTYTHPGDKLCYDALVVEDVKVVNNEKSSEVTISLRNVTAQPVEFMFYVRYFGETPQTEFRTKGRGTWHLKLAPAGETVSLHSVVSNPGVRAVALTTIPYRAKKPVPPREPAPEPDK